MVSLTFLLRKTAKPFRSVGGSLGRMADEIIADEIIADALSKARPEKA